jgi:gas vesicle protein
MTLPMPSVTMTVISFIRLIVIGSNIVIELLQAPIITDLHLSRIADLHLSTLLAFLRIQHNSHSCCRKSTTNTVTTGNIMKLQSIFLSFWIAGLTTFAFPLVTTLGRRKPLTEHHDLNDRVVVLETEMNIYKELKGEIKESSEKLSKDFKDGMKELREDIKGDNKELKEEIKSVNEKLSKEIKSVNENLSKEIKSVNETLVKIFVFLAVLSTLGGMASFKDITGLFK